MRSPVRDCLFLVLKVKTLGALDPTAGTTYGENGTQEDTSDPSTEHVHPDAAPSLLHKHLI